MSSYRLSNPLSTRKNDYNTIKSKYFNRIPVIVEFASNIVNFAQVSNLSNNKKFLVPDTLPLMTLVTNVRKISQIKSSDTLLLFIDSKIYTGSTSMNDIYDEYTKKHKDDEDFDGFLYVQATKESVFGI